MRSHNMSAHNMSAHIHAISGRLVQTVGRPSLERPYMVSSSAPLSCWVLPL
jgi:hypothetical protein